MMLKVLQSRWLTARLLSNKGGDMGVASLGLDSLETVDLETARYYTKSKTTRVHVKHYQEGIDYTNAVPPTGSWSFDRRSVGSLSSSMAGWRLPGWEALVASGSSATTPFNGSKQRFIPGGDIDGEVIRLKTVGNPKDGTYRCFVKGLYGQNPLTAHFGSVMANSARAESKAIVSLRRAIKAQYAQWDSLTFLAELGETIAQFRKPFKSLLSSLLLYNHNLAEIRKASVRIKAKAKRVHAMTKALSDAYLEFSFGVKPLMRDTQEAAEALARYIQGDEIVHSEVRGFGADSDARSVLSKESLLLASYIMFDEMMKEQSDILVIYRAGVSRKINGPERSVARLQQLTGFDLQQFIPTIWNALPWSFLADYIYNIGDVLEADYVDTSSVRWVNRSQVQISQRKISLIFNESYTKRVLGAALLTVSGTDGASTSEYRSVSRSALGYVPYPAIVRKIDFPNQLSDTKTANLIALTVSSILGHQSALPRIAARGH